jgi:hypothetical protein
MTSAETCRLVAVVQALWPHQRLANETPKVWHPLLRRFSLEDAEASVRELAADGREWPPPVGVIVKTLADRATEIPEWDEVWHEINRIVRRYGSYHLPPEEAFSHPIVAAFARPAWHELCTAPAPGTNGHGTHKAQQREAFNALRSRAQRDTGLAAIGAPRRAGLRQLETGIASALPTGRHDA